MWLCKKIRSYWDGSCHPAAPAAQSPALVKDSLLEKWGKSDVSSWFPRGLSLFVILFTISPVVLQVQSVNPLFSDPPLRLIGLELSIVHSITIIESHPLHIKHLLNGPTFVWIPYWKVVHGWCLILGDREAGREFRLFHINVVNPIMNYPKNNHKWVPDYIWFRDIQGL